MKKKSVVKKPYAGKKIFLPRIAVVSFYIFAFLVFECQFFSCATLSSSKKTAELQNADSDSALLSEKELIPAEIIWQSVEQGLAGIDVTSHLVPAVNVTWHCVRIDLDTPNLEITAWPDAQSGESFFSLKAFSKKTQSLVAVNSVPFHVEQTDSGKKPVPSGIVKTDREILAKPNEKYCALTFYSECKIFESPKFENASLESLNHEGAGQNLRARIIPKQTPELLEESLCAYGGFYVILENGRILPFRRTRRSRTGVGISHNGRYLYLLAVSPVFSPTDRNGLCYEECALILKSLGCTDAMQFDGGHYSGLFAAGKYLERSMFARKIPAALGIKVKSNQNN